MLATAARSAVGTALRTRRCAAAAAAARTAARQRSTSRVTCALLARQQQQQPQQPLRWWRVGVGGGAHYRGALGLSRLLSTAADPKPPAGGSGAAPPTTTTEQTPADGGGVHGGSGGGGDNNAGDEDEHVSLGPLRVRRVNVNVPNLLTVVRIAMALPVGYLFYIGEHRLAFYGFFIAGSCDFFDGYLARRWNQKTVLGAMLDPAADKLLVASLAIPMAVTGALPFWLSALIVGRDVGLMSVGFWHRFRTRTPGSFLFDTKEVNFTVEATNLSKANMALQSLLIMVTLTHSAFALPGAELLTYLQYTVGLTTAGSWAQYLVMFLQGDAYKNRDDVE